MKKKSLDSITIDNNLINKIHPPGRVDAHAAAKHATTKSAKESRAAALARAKEKQPADPDSLQVDRKSQSKAQSMTQRLASKAKAAGKASKWATEKEMDWINKFGGGRGDGSGDGRGVGGGRASVTSDAKERLAHQALQREVARYEAEAAELRAPGPSQPKSTTDVEYTVVESIDDKGRKVKKKVKKTTTTNTSIGGESSVVGATVAAGSGSGALDGDTPAHTQPKLAGYARG